MPFSVFLDDRLTHRLRLHLNVPSVNCLKRLDSFQIIGNTGILSNDQEMLRHLLIFLSLEKSRRSGKYAQIEARRFVFFLSHSMNSSSFRVIPVSIITGHSYRSSMRHGSIHQKKKYSERFSLIRPLELSYPPSYLILHSHDDVVVISK